MPLSANQTEFDRDDWLALVNKALDGADFDRRLASKTYDGIPIEPLYSRVDRSELVGDAGLTMGPERAKGDAPWDIVERYAGSDPSDVNAAILTDLEGGATSLLLQLSAPGQFGLPLRRDAIDAALQGVHLEMVPVALSAGDQYIGAALSLADIWHQRAVPEAARRGAYDADPLGSLARTGVLETDIYESLRTLAKFASGSLSGLANVTLMLADGRPYHEAGGGEAQELACMVATAVSYMRALEEEGCAPHQSLPKIRFALAADTDMFLTVAKFRAARLLMARIAEVSGAPNAARSLHLWAQTSERMMASRDMHVNMLRTTVATAAAALGGANSITVLPFCWPAGRPDAFVRRMARNTQIILQEESALGRVTDTGAGSGYIETLTNKLCQSAWELFQKIEKEGGMEEALRSGSIADAVAETAARRQADVATAGLELIGISSFPNLDSEPSKIEPHPSPAPIETTGTRVQPLAAIRLSEPFEQLRDGADVYAATTGGRAEVFLATIGQPTDFSARAGFTRNLFASGGIGTIESGDGHDAGELVKNFQASGATIACICSSDKIYTERALETIEALVGAGATAVYLAGKPASDEQQLRSAGLTDFIYLGCNQLDVLARAHLLLGIGGGGLDG